ncbi:MAG: hypothetical protein AB7D02_00210 [Candidatus Paceibacterota bacterium]
MRLKDQILILLIFLMGFLFQINFSSRFLHLFSINFLLLFLILIFLKWEKVNSFYFFFLSLIAGLFFDILNNRVGEYLFIFPLALMPLFLWFSLLEKKSFESQLIGGLCSMGSFYLMNFFFEFFLKKINFFELIFFNFLINFFFFLLFLIFASGIHFCKGKLPKKKNFYAKLLS